MRLQYMKKDIISNLNPITILMALQKVVNPKFDNPIIQYLFGYVNVLIGAVGTILLQSSSIFTSTLTPMVGVGLVEVETVYPLFLGKTLTLRLLLKVAFFRKCDVFFTLPK